jgi:hypothetical protein
MASLDPTKPPKCLEVYIDVLTNPLLQPVPEKRSGHASLASKENKNPTLPMSSPATSSDKPTRKRKLSNSNSINPDLADNLKKRRPSEETDEPNGQPKPDPSTYFYCHQCGKRRDLPRMRSFAMLLLPADAF